MVSGWSDPERSRTRNTASRGRVVHAEVAGPGGVVENARIAGEERRLQAARRGDEQTIERIGQRVAWNRAGVQGNRRLSFRDANPPRLQRFANPLLDRPGQTNPAHRVQRRNLEDGGRRDADRLPGLGAGEQLPRTPADPPAIAFDAPEPDVRVQKDHESAAVDLVLAVNRIERPVELEQRALHRSEERLPFPGT